MLFKPPQQPSESDQEIVHSLTEKGETVRQNIIAQYNIDLEKGGRREERRLQRLSKIDPAKGAFRNYYGLTFISVLSEEARTNLDTIVDSLKKCLSDKGLLHYFLFLPPHTYHITFDGVIERVIPDVNQGEVNYYYYESTDGRKLVGVPFEVEMTKFSKYPNLVLYVNLNFVQIVRISWQTPVIACLRQCPLLI